MRTCQEKPPRDAAPLAETVRAANVPHTSKAQPTAKNNHAEAAVNVNVAVTTSKLVVQKVRKAILLPEAAPADAVDRTNQTRRLVLLVRFRQKLLVAWSTQANRISPALHSRSMCLRLKLRQPPRSHLCLCLLPRLVVGWGVQLSCQHCTRSCVQSVLIWLPFPTRTVQGSQARARETGVQASISSGGSAAADLQAAAQGGARQGSGPEQDPSSSC